jgi:hypothetical protein
LRTIAEQVPDSDCTASSLLEWAAAIQFGRPLTTHVLGGGDSELDDDNFGERNKMAASQMTSPEWTFLQFSWFYCQFRTSNENSESNPCLKIRPICS